MLSSGCATVTPLRLPVTPTTLDAEALVGTWHVVGTTFPMWLDGTRRRPRFTYSNPTRTGAVTTLDDEVAYETKGERGTIVGVDTQSAEVPTHFTWRGRGLLSLFTSEWDVVFLSAGGDWALITFSQTLATPAGLDVISRTRAFNPEAWLLALQVIDAHEELRALASGLTPLTDR